MAAGSTLLWPSLQKRTYENGNSDNRLAFFVVDSDNNSLYKFTDTVASVSLYGNVTSGNPDGDEITIPAHVFLYYSNIYGHYDAGIDEYVYDADFSQENYFSVNYTTPALAAID